VVRFRPGRYEPPQRVGHNLSERQQEVLRCLHAYGPQSLSEIMTSMGSSAAATERQLRQDLQLLKQLGLVELDGWGRGSRWVPRR